MGTSFSLRIIPNMAESRLASGSGPTLGHTIGLHRGHAPCQLLVDYDNANNSKQCITHTHSHTV
jgi:hypothetical protein